MKDHVETQKKMLEADVETNKKMLEAKNEVAALIKMVRGSVLQTFLKDLEEKVMLGKCPE